MDKKNTTWRDDAAQVLRGVGMGSADVIPGVSGGTVALVLGIYERLITALSRFDLSLLQMIRQRKWRQAAQHIDLRFLATLAGGIGIGFLIMSKLMNVLLTQPFTRTMTLAAFFGMILATCILVGGMVGARGAKQLLQRIVIGAVAAAIAYLLTVYLEPQGEANAAPSLGYLFFCGLVAICAMILPGVSGAMLLLILGAYVYMTDIPHAILRGEDVAGGVLTIFVFGAGCAIGLLFFSKLLRWLLENHHSVTMAVLCGFIVGALPKLWPFQKDITPHVEKFKYKIFRSTWPDALTWEVAAALFTAIIGIAIVFALHRWTGAGAEMANAGSLCEPHNRPQEFASELLNEAQPGAAD